MEERKVTRQLEDEALTVWTTKPDEERLIKVGWFRKAKDCNLYVIYIGTEEK